MHGFIKIASAIPAVSIADCDANIKEIKRLIDEAEAQGCAAIVFPELSITGYSCQDLFLNNMLLSKAQEALSWLLSSNKQSSIAAIIGMPLMINDLLINAAIVLQGSSIKGIVPKTYLPNYKEFYEARWFASSDIIGEQTTKLCDQDVLVSSKQLFKLTANNETAIFGIEICEDLWTAIPPSSYLALQGAELIFNLSASNDLICKHEYLKSLIAGQSSRCICGYIYSSAGFGESTTDVVYGGNAMIYENGNCLAQSTRFSIEPQLIISDIDIEYLQAERRTNTSFAAAKRAISDKAKIANLPICQSANLLLHRNFNPHPFVPTGKQLDERCEEIFSIQTMGLAKRIIHTKAKSIVIGISGGLDSTLALLVSAKTMDKLNRSRKDIIAVTMPGFGTTGRTYNNAISLMQQLGVTIREISIVEACKQHFKDINHDSTTYDITYENAQARERTQILMDIANQAHGFVIGTGDVSELALGWCTYNADHMSNYAVNCSIPKTLVAHLVRWVALNSADEAAKDTLLDICSTPISPELIPADEQGNIKQKTEDLVGPYELHDFFLYHLMRLNERPSKIYFLAKLAFEDKYSDKTILHWLRTFCYRFFSQQFKRSCLPDGPKVGSVSLSPRGDWRMPSDASSNEWIKECESL